MKGMSQAALCGRTLIAAMPAGAAKWPAGGLTLWLVVQLVQSFEHGLRPPPRLVSLLVAVTRHAAGLALAEQQATPPGGRPYASSTDLDVSVTSSKSARSSVILLEARGQRQHRRLPHWVQAGAPW